MSLGAGLVYQRSPSANLTGARKGKAATKLHSRALDAEDTNIFVLNPLSLMNVLFSHFAFQIKSLELLTNKLLRPLERNTLVLS